MLNEDRDTVTGRHTLTSPWHSQRTYETRGTPDSEQALTNPPNYFLGVLVKSP